METTAAAALSIQVVVALYQCTWQESRSISSLLRILDGHEDWAKYFSLLLYDNSPQAQPAPTTATLPVTYIHDASNGGLAAAYNAALSDAERKQCEWLLLLDQDTTLTPEFAGELLAVLSNNEDSAMGAVVPKLIVHGALHSPATDFLTQLRTVRHSGPS